MIRPRKRGSQVPSSRIASVTIDRLWVNPAATRSPIATGRLLEATKPRRHRCQATAAASIVRAGGSRRPKRLSPTEPSSAPVPKLATSQPRPC